MTIIDVDQKTVAVVQPTADEVFGWRPTDGPQLT